MRMTVIITLMVFVLQGCGGVGLIAMGNRTASVKNPVISKNKGYMREGIAEVNLITSEELLDAWGKPDHIERVTTNKEEWTYNFGLRWNGIFALVVVVPVPLIVPVGHKYVTFTVENGKLISAYMKDISRSGAGCNNFEMKCESIDNGVSHGNEVFDKFWEKDASVLLREHPR